VKWHDEMAEKFGLAFAVVDSDRCAQVRREYGSAANPFNVYPLTLVSLPWLRGAKAQRLLDEVLPADGPSYPRTFDLLILDEAHHVAPAAPKQVYAVDSQQTKHCGLGADLGERIDCVLGARLAIPRLSYRRGLRSCYTTLD